MDDVLYSSILKYFNTLSSTGYISYNDVDKLLLLVTIEEFIYNDFRGFITENDYREIEKFLYKIFGTSCLTPYPNYCNNYTMNKLHLGDISELSYRVSVNEDNIEELQNTKVVKVIPSEDKIVDDIDTSIEGRG